MPSRYMTDEQLRKLLVERLVRTARLISLDAPSGIAANALAIVAVAARLLLRLSIRRLMIN